MNNITMAITKVGLNELKDELDELNSSHRPDTVNRLALARSMGDLSENSDYASAKEELSFIDGRIAELEEIIKSAKVVIPTASDKVDFGHSVRVKINSNGSEVVLQIVGEWEANPKDKKISAASPIGQALMGKKVGDKVEVTAPAGKLLYTIVGIE
jgi:transcription elongation factor GreA